MALADIKCDFSPFPNLTKISSNIVLGEEPERRDQKKKKEIYLIDSLERRKFVLILSVMPFFLYEYWSRQREQARTFWVARGVTYN